MWRSRRLAANILPQQTHDICAKFFAGDVAGSARLQLELLDLINALFMDVNPIPVKDAMNLMGMEVGGLRLPLLSMEDAQLAKLRGVLAAYGLVK